MPSTTNYKRGDVVLVPFPFTDLRSAKQRPALVISPDTLNSVRDDLLLAGITSQIPATRAADEFLIPHDQTGRVRPAKTVHRQTCQARRAPSVVGDQAHRFAARADTGAGIGANPRIALISRTASALT